MLYHLANYMTQYIDAFNVFRYLTSRTGLAVLTALAFIFLFGPALIRKLKLHQKNGQPIRTDGPKRHIIEKQGTPTMGGIMILSGIIVATCLWGDLTNPYLQVVITAMVAFGIVGAIDDYKKVTGKKGLTAKIRFMVEFLIAVPICFILANLANPDVAYALTIPFFKNVTIYMGTFFLIFGALVIVGAANAVNLTDGLDGLAIMPVMIAAASFAVIAYLVGNVLFANYLQINYVAGAGELAVICGAIFGAGLGFLWFNAPPAMIFMGDTGALSLGSVLGTIAVAVKHEIVLAIIGGLFVLETLSVIIQVTSFKLTGKRVFKMAPLHHHFEQKGWSEPTIVIRFWIIAVVLALIGLSTLKLR